MFASWLWVLFVKVTTALCFLFISSRILGMTARCTSPRWPPPTWATTPATLTDTKNSSRLTFFKWTVGDLNWSYLCLNNYVLSCDTSWATVGNNAVKFVLLSPLLVLSNVAVTYQCMFTLDNICQSSCTTTRWPESDECTVTHSDATHLDIVEFNIEFQLRVRHCPLTTKQQMDAVRKQLCGWH